MSQSPVEFDREASPREVAMWMLHRLAGNGVCNLPIAFRVSGQLRWRPLQAAVDRLLARNPDLRTTFRPEAGGLRARTRAANRAHVEVLTRALENDSNEAVTAQLRSIAAEPFDDLDEILVRTVMLMGTDFTVVSVVLHHLVSDLWAARNTAYELAAAYDDYAAAGAEPVDEVWGIEGIPSDPTASLETGETIESVRYWVESLRGVDPQRLPMAHARDLPARPTFAGGRAQLNLTTAATDALARVRDRGHNTDLTVLLGTFAMLLAQHGSGPDIVVGVPVSQRASIGGRRLGHYVSTLPIRMDIGAHDRSDEVLLRAREAFLSGFKHRAVSFEDLPAGQIPRSSDWRTPLFRHAFNFRPPADLSLRDNYPRLTLADVDVDSGFSRLDLELNVAVDAEGIHLDATYSTEAHDATQIQQLLTRYETLLIALGDGDRAAAEPVPSPADRALLTSVNATARTWPPGSVAEFVVTRAQENPDAPAVDGTSRGQLLGLIGGVRRRLIAAGVRAGDVVAVCGPRTPVQAAALVGVWTAGASYLPLGEDPPPGRATTQLTDADVSIVLHDGPLPVPVDADLGRARPMVTVDLRTIVPAELPPNWDTGPDAYVLFTSGSTGRPKAVIVPHPALANLVLDMIDRFKLSSDDVVLWSTSTTFDISALEVFASLVTGAHLRCASMQTVIEPGALLAVVQSAGVDLVQATPSLWRYWLESAETSIAGLRAVVGGEAVNAALANALLARGAQVWNVYGPTETTIWSTAAALAYPVYDPVTIGRPVANTQVHVLDENGRVQLPGLPGELCIAGDGVANYYRDPVRTAERFRDDPELGRYYRTGDQAVLDADGRLTYLGRRDRQVKVRGVRIELGEVEAVLETASGVTAAAAVVAGSDPEHLVVQAIARLDAGTDIAAILAHAARQLAGAAVPARLLPVETIPMLPSGKIDYTAVQILLDADRQATAADAIEDAITRELLALWRSYLQTERVDVDSHFFQKGGHSLAAVQLAAHAEQRLGRPVPFDAVFGAPTPRALAQLLRAAAWIGVDDGRI